MHTSEPDSELTVAVGQFAVADNSKANAAQVEDMIEQASQKSVDLLVLPEGVMARFMDRKEQIREAAQAIDGPFVSRIREFSADHELTVIFGIHESNDEPRPYNTLVALRAGKIIVAYRKLHLYDAFSQVESDNVRPGDELPPLIEVGDFKIGLMTCYDIRFPEMARLLALEGADALAIPAAWAKGFGKERQWSTLVSARALDNTAYVLASGESGASCIGTSIIADPLGRPMTTSAYDIELAVTTLSRKKLTAIREALPVLEHIRFTTNKTSTPPTRAASLKERA